MIEIIGCILLIIIGIFFICMTVDELRTNYKIRKSSEQRSDNNDLLKENQELKKQLEESDRKLFFTKNELDMREKSIDDKLTQQKEFIKWLENYINLFDKKDIYEEGSCDTIEEILQKYKEIIGE